MRQGTGHVRKETGVTGDGSLISRQGNFSAYNLAGKLYGINFKEL